MDPDVQAQQITDLEAARMRAEVIEAFYDRLRARKKVPVAAARDFTIYEFWPDMMADDE